MCYHALKIHSYVLKLGKWTCMPMKHQLLKSRAHFLCLDGLTLDCLYQEKPIGLSLLTATHIISTLQENHQKPH